MSFPSTCWTEIKTLRADGSEAAKQKMLSRFCENYWFPLYAFARHRSMSTHDAEDAVQSFFLTVGDSDYFLKADHEKGKLRTFILTGFTRHLKDLKVRALALKRGGGESILSLDTEQAEEWLFLDPASAESPTLAFEKHWARNIIRTVINTLKSQAAGDPPARKRFEILSRFLNPETCATYTAAEAATELNISTDACQKAIQRLRQTFRLAVREQVAATLDNPDEESVMEEMIQLQKSLAGS